MIWRKLGDGLWHSLMGKFCPKCFIAGQPPIYSESQEYCPGHGVLLSHNWSENGLTEEQYQKRTSAERKGEVG